MNIFISYRREDSADITGRIYDSMLREFDKESLFKDVDSIPLGVDFKEYLTKMVSQCQILLVVIGKQWLSVTDKNGKPRLWNPSDFVSIEIAVALERDIPIIPLLVQNAEMPGEESLPATLSRLSYRNGTVVRPDPDFHTDMERLIRGVKKHCEIPITNKTSSTEETISTSSDKRYNVTKVGIIHDTKTGLEWLVGTDQNITWFQAKAWVENIDSSLYGTGWRMPTLKELSSIYEQGKGTNNKHLDSVFKISNIRLWIWTGEVKDSLSAYTFYFGDNGCNDCNECAKSYHDRVIAVRGMK